MSQLNQKNDHKNTKIFVGGLTWRTTSDDLRNFFQRFGEILDTNVVYESYPGRSKGYGFVVFKDAEAAAKVCEEEYYNIDGRKANVNLAYLGAKNKNYQSNQNGSLNQARPLHHCQNMNSYVPPPPPPPFYWYPHYGQYYPPYPCHQPYPTSMINHNYYGPTYLTQHDWNQTNNHQPLVMSMSRSNPIRISAPKRSSSPRLESIDETNEKEVNVDVVHQENNKEEMVTKPDNDHDQEANDELCCNNASAKYEKESIKNLERRYVLLKKTSQGKMD